ncbi:MAG: outer membrane beta-barrel protein [Paludibacteraceae bacterium]|nr:outer membrane beta-barrel protein [Paludibacteraceae bacterium]
MQRLGIIGVLLCLCAMGAWADDATKPGYQIEDNTFFDPSHKEMREESYQFSVDYRLEVGFAQNWQRPHDITFAERYLHGIRLGANFTFNLPLHFGIQTGVIYTLLFGQNDQHWRSVTAPTTQEEYITHNVLAHNLTVPVRMTYTIPVWKKMNILFYTGPQLHIGLAQNDYMKTHLSDPAKDWLVSQNIPVDPYDRMKDELVRANIQWGIGAGIEWDKYRLQGGYDFGLNNMVKHPKISGQYMSEWGWFVSFCYKF